MSLSKNPDVNALLARASDDQVTCGIAGLPDSVFGQHAQAAIEKYYKALLNELAGSHPYIHDLQQLCNLLTKAGEKVPASTISLSHLSLYAAHLRYDDDSEVAALDRQVCMVAIETARHYVERRVKQLNQQT